MVTHAWRAGREDGERTVPGSFTTEADPTLDQRVTERLAEKMVRDSYHTIVRDLFRLRNSWVWTPPGSVTGERAVAPRIDAYIGAVVHAIVATIAEGRVIGFGPGDLV